MWKSFAEEGTAWIDPESEVAVYLMPSAEFNDLVRHGLRASEGNETNALSRNRTTQDSYTPVVVWAWNLTVHY